MAYNDDAVLAKLSALNETHDSIATAAQWIMFHRRRADRTVQLWMQRLKDSSSGKRLNLVYLANEVTQQSKVRHKDEFVLAFSPIVAEATAIAYKGATAEIQGKLRRVVDVWRDRSIFEGPIQAAIEARIDELDRLRGAPKSGFGSSSITASPSKGELAPITALLAVISKSILPTKTALSTSQQEFDKLTDPSSPIRSAPVYAARLNGLFRTLVSTENTISENVSVRKEVVQALESLLERHRVALDEEEQARAKLSAQKLEIEMKKQEVEMTIMRGLGPSDHVPRAVSSATAVPELDRPEMEALTPPGLSDEDEAPIVDDRSHSLKMGIQSPTALLLEPRLDLDGHSGNHSAGLMSWPNKRRRLDDDIPDLGSDDGMDDEVVELLEGGHNHD